MICIALFLVRDVNIINTIKKITKNDQNKCTAHHISSCHHTESMKNNIFSIFTLAVCTSFKKIEKKQKQYEDN